MNNAYVKNVCFLLFSGEWWFARSGFFLLFCFFFVFLYDEGSMGVACGVLFVVGKFVLCQKQCHKWIKHKAALLKKTNEKILGFYFTRDAWRHYAPFEERIRSGFFLRQHFFFCPVIYGCVVGTTGPNLDPEQYIVSSGWQKKVSGRSVKWRQVSERPWRFASESRFIGKCP